jgi:hypothetical protein
VKYDEEVYAGGSREIGAIDNPIASNLLFTISKSSQSINANLTTSLLPHFSL